ncbi:MAG TPA: hypothetical protein VF677_00600 [Flavobacterium sp.]|jgi:hypothetical protein
MEPNKIEKQFRDKLNSREIQPSEMAWDRLDAMLSVAEEKKVKPRFGWMYIAASITGFIVIATVFLTQTQDVADVEKSTVNREKIIKNQPAITIPAITPTVPKTGHAVAIKNKNNNIKKQSTTAVSESASVVKVTESRVSINNQKTEKSINNQSLVINDEDHSIGNQASETTAPAKSTSLKVDANALLSQVDGELELSFREKAIKILKKNYKSVKVAVSARNQQ